MAGETEGFFNTPPNLHPILCTWSSRLFEKRQEGR